jgi:HAD superfamily hydrolase (TIGR01509 family)
LQSARYDEEMPRAVIFDVDGTLVDSVDLHARAWQDAFRMFGKELPFEDIRYQIGKGGDQLMPVFFSREELQRFGEEMQKTRTRIYRERYQHQVRPFPNVRELFERIKRDGKRIALASSADQQDFDANLKLLQIGDLIDGATSSEDAERSKPFPDIFAAAVAKLDGLHPAEAVAVGDTHYDAEAAGQIGLRTIGVRCGGFPEEDLRAAGCVEIWQDPADMLENYERTALHQ